MNACNTKKRGNPPTKRGGLPVSLLVQEIGSLVSAFEKKVITRKELKHEVNRWATISEGRRH